MSKPIFRGRRGKGNPSLKEEPIIIGSNPISELQIQYDDGHFKRLGRIISFNDTESKTLYSFELANIDRKLRSGLKKGIKVNWRIIVYSDDSEVIFPTCNSLIKDIYDSGLDINPIDNKSKQAINIIFYLHWKSEDRESFERCWHMYKKSIGWNE